LGRKRSGPSGWRPEQGFIAELRKYATMASKKRFKLIFSILFFLMTVAASVKAVSNWWLAAIFACAVVWRLFPQLEARLSRWADEVYRKRRAKERQADLARRVVTESEVEITEKGIHFLGKNEKNSVSWDNIFKIELVWDENPWGDPQFGRYNDVCWRIESSELRCFDIDDTDVHRFVVQTAFAKYLAGYSYVHNGYNHLFTVGPGSEVCWARNLYKST